MIFVKCTVSVHKGCTDSLTSSKYTAAPVQSSKHLCTRLQRADVRERRADRQCTRTHIRVKLTKVRVALYQLDRRKNTKQGAERMSRVSPPTTPPPQRLNAVLMLITQCDTMHSHHTSHLGHQSYLHIPRLLNSLRPDDDWVCAAHP